MTKMRNAEVVDNFVRGNDNCEGSNLYSENKELINYKTVIAIRTVDYIALNSDYYSPTTSVHQNRIRRSGYDYIEVTEDEIKDIQAGFFIDKPIMNNEKVLEMEDNLY